ncbi:MAG: hypothetical protein PUD89_08155 [Bacteroidales bacterium]|nr:hypothetical protein [Bacteroidales bacterium]
MKQTVLNLPILDLNDNEMRYIGDDDAIHAHTFAEILSKQMQKVAVPLGKIDVYKGVFDKIDAALTSADAGIITEFSDDEFAIVSRKVESSFDRISKWRWDRMIEELNMQEK